MLLTQIAEGARVPNLPWASFIPAHFLPIWKSFLITLQTDRATASKKDELIEQLLPIFHNPNIVLPMRILTVQEVRKLAGLENILTTERHGPSLLTDKVIRDFCGNSFHPSLISAALGTDDQLQQWVEGNNDAQPYHKDLPSIQEVYSKYQDLLKLVLEQAAARGVQLRDDKVDFEAKWRHYSLNDNVESVCPPVVHQPTVFAFLQGSNPPKYHGAHSEDKPPFGDKELSSIMTQTRIDWVLESSNTYENVTLSAHMLYLAVKNGLGFHSEAQEIKAKHIELLKEYTGAEQLTAIKQLFVVFQIATLSVKHQFPYGFIIWAPKIMQPPLIYVGVQRPCLLFLLLSHEPDQPFRFGTVAFDYRQSKDLLIHANMPKIFADVVQVSYHTFATYPILARIDNGQHYIHLSEFAALQCPFCALCYLHTLGAPQCFMHNASPASTVIHLLGGLDGTGGLSIIGVLARDVSGAIPQWIAIHVVDNHQVQDLADSKSFVAYKVATPVVWSPMWYAQSSSMRRMPRQIGTQLIQSHTLDPSGEYLIFASTEEWSRLLFALGEAPTEGVN